MKRLKRHFVTPLLFLLSLLHDTSSASPIEEQIENYKRGEQHSRYTRKFVPDQVVVKVMPSSILSETQSKTTGVDFASVLGKGRVKSQKKAFTAHALTNAKHSSSGTTPNFKTWHVITLHDKAYLQRALDKLRAHADIEYAEPNYILSTVAVPDDPFYTSHQWAHSRTAAEQAWDEETGYENVIIAIVDTGVETTHPDLSASVIEGYDFVNDDTDANDDHGHGTHVAGIAAANGNNALGVAGVNWSSKIMPVKVLSAGGWGITSDVANGIRFAADNGAHIINLSLGATSLSRILKEAVAYADSLGVIVVAGAGNNGNEKRFYPAAFSEVIAVASTTIQDEMSSFSSHGVWVDIAAPGSSIYSTTRFHNYGYLSGTSMASPYIAGVASLVISKYPEATKDYIWGSLLSGADTIYPSNSTLKGKLGAGRVNAYRALTTDPLPYLKIEKIKFDDSLKGNDDGRLSPGETGDLRISLTNRSIPAHNMQVELRTTEQKIELSTSSTTLSSISFQEVKEVVFEITISHDLPYMEVPFDLSIRSIEGNFPLTFSQSVTAPFTLCENATDVIPVECDTLVTLYRATSGEEWIDNAGWKTDPQICAWFGVTCRDGHVAELSLKNNNLNGSLPEELGTLQHLELLRLTGNSYLVGEIPPSLGSLSKLQTLSLNSNSLSGSIPKEIGNLANLTTLELRANMLTGGIPDELGNLSSLVSLDLGSNELGGTIPASLGNLKEVQLLWLSDSGLHGPLPRELGNLLNLKYLFLYYNKLSGTIPRELGMLTNLEFLDLYSNSLEGEIPEELGTLPKLTYLLLHGNNLTGAVPRSFGERTFLYLDISYNYLDELPSELLTMQVSYGLSLDGNYLVTYDQDLFNHLESMQSNWFAKQRDRDGDRVLDIFEDRNSNSNFEDDDTDRDSTWDYIDIDDDGDGIATRAEGPDPNGDGWVDDAIDSDNDGSPNFLDACNTDPLKVVPGICGCGRPDLDSNNDNLYDCNDSDNDGISDKDEHDLGTDPNSADSDKDGVNDRQEIDDGSDPLDRGSHIERLATTVCAEWNGFLGLHNFMEHVNIGEAGLTLTTTLYDIEGNAQERVSFALQPGLQQDIPVHDMRGFTRDSYGKVCTTYSGTGGALSGRMSLYLPARLGGFEFAFSTPFLNGKKGGQFVSFNTFQPSFNLEDANNLVANWINLTNLEDTPQRGTLYFYDIAGDILATKSIRIDPQARRDLSGHQFGNNLVGIIEWRPVADDARFQLRNVRYFYAIPTPDGPQFATAAQFGGTDRLR